MKISRSADCALRVIIYLAKLKGDSSTMPELAERLDVPYNNLSKLIQTMAKAGILQTRQGKHGGVRLLKTPQEISLKMIIDLIDGPTRLSDCFHQDGMCALESFCKLQGVLFNIQDRIDNLLKSVYITEMM